MMLHADRWPYLTISSSLRIRPVFVHLRNLAPMGPDAFLLVCAARYSLHHPSPRLDSTPVLRAVTACQRRTGAALGAVDVVDVVDVVGELVDEGEAPQAEAAGVAALLVAKVAAVVVAHPVPRRWNESDGKTSGTRARGRTTTEKRGPRRRRRRG